MNISKYADSPASHFNRNQMPHLTDAQRAVLLALIAANPDSTCAQIAASFQVCTGRRLSDVAVRRAWVVGYKPSRRGMSKEVTG